MTKNKRIVLDDGREFANLEEALKFFNLKRGTYYQRLRRGSTVTEALTKQMNDREIKNPIGTKIVKSDGTTYSSFKEAAKAHGLQTQTVIARTMRGWSVDDALNTPANSTSAKATPITVEGVEYPTLTDALKKYKVKKSTYYNRLNFGWSSERAITVPVSIDESGEDDGDVNHNSSSGNQGVDDSKEGVQDE